MVDCVVRVVPGGMVGPTGRPYPIPQASGRDAAVAAARQSRWVSLSPTGATGQMLTRLVTFSNNELYVNANAQAGRLLVELVDVQTGQAIPGYSRADCDAITADALDEKVTWKGQSDLSQIIGTARCQPQVGRALLIRLVLEAAVHLYAFSC